MTDTDAIPSVSSKKQFPPCSVCGDDGFGLHFGINACRACTAFFRRTVSLEKKYFCKHGGTCIIAADVRSMCRGCRYKKCIDTGMNPNNVQKKRDVIGKRSSKNNDIMEMLKNYDFDLLSDSQADQNIKHELFSKFMPQLQKIRDKYILMDSKRAAVHKTGKKRKLSRCATYRESHEMLIRELSLVADWLSESFESFRLLSLDQKKLMFRNFFIPFLLLESAYLCHINNRQDVVILQSGDYIDIEQLEYYYTDVKKENQGVTPTEAAKMFKPSLEWYRKCLIIPLRHENIDVHEFFLLCSLVLWDFGIEGQNDICCRTSSEIRDSIIREITLYERIVKKCEDPSLRIATILCILPSLQKIARRFHEDIELTKVFNIYAPDDEFYHLINGKFE